LSFTVKKLIADLEKIENKFLEVECRVTEGRYVTQEIDRIQKINKKVLIVTKDMSDE
jgi:hypothetical protein